jgi:hypothetical protein
MERKYLVFAATVFFIAVFFASDNFIHYLPLTIFASICTIIFTLVSIGYLVLDESKA